jgi:ribonuclease-3
MNDKSVFKIQKILGYEFSNKELLKTALTHKSHGAINNDRMEFLGDSILGFVVAKYLYSNFKDKKSGALTCARTNIVNGSRLANLEISSRLVPFLMVGNSLLNTDFLNNEAIKEDLMESIISAIYLDSDIYSVEKCIISWFGDLYTLGETPYEDPKSLLQEILQQKKMDLPVYKSFFINNVFRTKCCIDDKEYLGVGNTKKQSEQNVASKIVLDIK